MVEGGVTYTPDNLTEEIDIILPTHGRLYDLTIPCVSAIYAHTRSRFHLVVVDDSTPDMPSGIDNEPDKTLAWFERLQIEQTNITVLHNDKQFRNGNQMFNAALQYCQNRFVATVMNSVRVEPDWDVVAVQMMRDLPQIGIIGLKCIKDGWGNPEDGKVECAGIAMNGFTPVDMGRSQPAHQLCNSYPCFSLQWAFALLRKEAVVGNLDENIWEGFVGFDDIDNTLVLRSKGWEAW